MVSLATYETIKDRYGWCSSWAVWAPRMDTARSGVSDLSVFDDQRVIEGLHTRHVLVGLNISRDPGAAAFSNFHSGYLRATDYKLREALQGTPIWGAYMTDIIKGFEQVDSQQLVAEVRANPALLKENIDSFVEEIKVAGATAEDTKFIALGSAAFKIMKSNLPSELKLNINQAPHYAASISHADYRKAFSQHY